MNQMISIFFVLLLWDLSFSKTAAPGEVIFQHDFAKEKKLNTKIFTPEITASGGGNWEFEYYSNSRQLAYIENGVLFIEPKLTKDALGLEPTQDGVALEPGSAYPDSCSDPNSWGCRRQTGGANIINPIASSRFSTKNSFSFKYGNAEVVAKLPCGDWAWPAIWFLPRHTMYGSWPGSGEIDLMESRGNVGAMLNGKKYGPEAFSSTLHWGPRYDQNRWDLTHSEYQLPSGSFCDAFHTFGMIWTAESISIYLDIPSNIVGNFQTKDMWAKGGYQGNNIWQTGGPNAPFDEEYYFVMNVAIGGTGGFFSDAASYPRGKPWNDKSQIAPMEFYNARGNWFPTWSDRKAALQIKSIIIKAVEGTEYTENI